MADCSDFAKVTCLQIQELILCLPPPHVSVSCLDATRPTVPNSVPNKQQLIANLEMSKTALADVSTGAWRQKNKLIHDCRTQDQNYETAQARIPDQSRFS